MAVSLPPDLDHHYSQQHLVVNHTPNNGTSTENLQCQWHCNELPKFDIRPQVIIAIILQFILIIYIGTSKFVVVIFVLMFLQSIVILFQFIVFFCNFISGGPTRRISGR